MAAVSRFCVFWIRNTIRNVTMVVPVLMTSCQVSLKPNSGPVTSPGEDGAEREPEGHGTAGELRRLLRNAREPRRFLLPCMIATP